MVNSKILKKPLNNNPLHWLKWVAFFVILTIIFFPLLRFIKEQLAKNEEKTASIEKKQKFQSNLNPITQKLRAEAITKNIELHNIAKNLAHNLGTLYSDRSSWWSWLNPKGWTENDKLVADNLQKGRLNYPIIQRLYFECYSNSRNLSNDILEYLDANELKRVQKFLKI